MTNKLKGDEVYEEKINVATVIVGMCSNVAIDGTESTG